MLISLSYFYFLHAEDIALFSDSAAGLQNGLNKLYLGIILRQMVHLILFRVHFLIKQEKPHSFQISILRSL